VSRESPVNISHLVTLLLLLVLLVSDWSYKRSLEPDTLFIQIIQFFVADDAPSRSTLSRQYTPTASSPAANLDVGVCESPPPFPIEQPISRSSKMSVLGEAKRIAAEFEYTDDDVRKGVAEFMKQMGRY